MQFLQVAFDRPVFLLLLLVWPFLVIIGHHTFSSLGRGRYWLALAFRSALLLLLTCALAEIQLVRISQKVVAYFLLDQSDSVDSDQQQAAFDYVRSASQQHRSAAIGDMTGLIVFGNEAQIEQPAANASLEIARRETTLEQNRTNIASALRLAKASFPEGAAKRIVLLSDGNQNLGDALTQSSELAADGIGIDVAPLVSRPRSDVVVDKVTAPARARIGVPYDVNIVLDHRAPTTAAATSRATKNVSGRLVVMRRADGAAQLVADQSVSLPPGKSFFTFRQEQDQASFYTYEAKFVPDDAGADKFSQNNQATAFTHIRGRGKVLFIVNGEALTEFDSLVAVLRRHELEVTVQGTDGLFQSLAELQAYDCVVLGDVPRTSGDAADSLVQFSDAQIDMLVKNVEQLGAGLIMLGGPNSFGAGGWSNTALEQAMPVDFQIKNSKVEAVGALLLVIDKSGSMAGVKLDMCRAAAKAAVGMLGPHDQIGVIAFDSSAEEIVRLQPVGDFPTRIKSQIDRLTSGGGTDLEPGMRRGYEALRRVKASIKHMIVLTDGQTQGSGYASLAAQMRRENITTTTVAVGNDAAKGMLADVASRGGGKYYTAVNPRVLPKIFTRETRRVVRPLLFEDPSGLAVIRQQDHEILAGVAGGLPPVTGFVLTSIKANPLVEVPLVAARPNDPNNAILAAWNYGLGRTVALTTDAGQRWAQPWTSTADFDKLFVQMVRWSMRSINDHGEFTVSTNLKDGSLAVVVQALTNEGDFLNGLTLQGSLVRDDGSSEAELPFSQVGPGRYLGEIVLDQAGSYLVSIFPGRGYGVLRSGVEIPYSPEFRDMASNEALLMELAARRTPNGTHGEIIRLPDDPATWSRFQGPNVFRRDLPPGRSYTNVWPLVLLIAAGVFFADVFNRRVTVPWDALQRALMRVVRSRSEVPIAESVVDRLKAAKREATVRFEPTNRDDPAAIQTWKPGSSRAGTPSSASSESPPQWDGSEPTYSERLLKAKRAIRQQSNKPESRPSDDSKVPPPTSEPPAQ